MAVTGGSTEMHSGDKRELRYTVTDEDTAGSPAKNLTGLTIKYAISKFKADGITPLETAILEKTSDTATELLVTDAAAGELTVFLDPTDTAALKNDYHEQLRVFDALDNPVVVNTATRTIHIDVINLT